MTGFFAAHQNGWFGDRFLTHQAWLGLSHHLLGFWIIHELKCEMRRGFFIEKQKGPVGGKGPMREKTHHAVGGEEVGDPPPPSLDSP